MSTALDDLIQLRTDLENDKDTLWAERYENRAKASDLSNEINALQEGSKRDALQAEYNRATARDRAIEIELVDKDRQLAALDDRITREEEIQQLMDFMGSGQSRGRDR